MRSAVRFFGFAVSLLAAVTGATPLSSRQYGNVGRAVYFMTNERTNSVVAIPIGSDGTLSGGALTATGGSGSNLINSATNAPMAPDALSAQSSVTISGDFLFAVNAGSNTLSVLRIDDTDPTKLTLVGKPIALPGDFPVTVAASRRNNLVCVGTTGAKAGISCAPFSPNGLGPIGALHPFNLHQTTPPVGPSNAIAQTFFSEDETRLLTTVKGGPAQNNTGFISVLPIELIASSSVASRDTHSSFNGTELLFGSTVIPGSSDILVTDASFGAAVFTLNPGTDEVSLVAKQVIPGQQATCWASYSQARRSVFVTDGALNRLVELSPKDAKVISTISLTNGDPGLIDLKAAGPLVYALSPGNGTTPAAITVVDPFSGQQVQHFQLDKLGAGKNSQGLAVLE